MSNFEVNNNFFGLKGVLGRRDFIVNFLIIELVESLLFATPLMIFIFTNSHTIESFTNSYSSAIFPMWFVLYGVCSGLISSVLFFPSFVRRIRDILAIEDDQKIYGISAVLSVLIFMGYLLGYVAKISLPLSILVIFILMFMQGKITGEKPKNNLIKFNWGAFLGTWVWGIFNKSPKTLWMIPLSFTTAGFIFMLICGLKGNEWAYEHKKDLSLDDFHSSQQKQSLIFTIITPILVIIMSIVIFITCIFALSIYSDKNPDFLKNLEIKASEMQSAAAKGTFAEIKLTDTEYKFYINPKIWVNMSRNQKSSTFSMAVEYVKKELGIKFSADSKIKQKESLALSNKVKIYSVFNNELLAEFNLTYDEVENALNNIGEKGGFKRYYNLLNNAHKFNDNPTLP